MRLMCDNCGDFYVPPMANHKCNKETFKAFQKQFELDILTKKFEEAHINLTRISDSLDKIVGQKIGHAKSLDDLHVLVDSLPRRYRGTRFVYEAMLRLEKEQ